ncbi:MAG: hypothetical protein HY015_05160 [Bacteroidetes bacterium]|nr:hypothetical protein [Bacteroidota bacterium]
MRRINFSSLQNAVTKLEKSTTAFAELFSAGPNTNLEQLNNLLYQSERKLLGDGLPRRPWYKHTIYAPGFYTGYGVKTLPGVREAIEQRNFVEAQQQIEIVSKTIEAFNQQVEAANKILMMK